MNAPGGSGGTYTHGWIVVPSWLPVLPGVMVEHRAGGPPLFAHATPSQPAASPASWSTAAAGAPSVLASHAGRAMTAIKKKAARTPSS
jgi:hypothetical protein